MADENKPQSQTVPMFSPDGTVGDVPIESVHVAASKGFKVGADLISPDGQTGTVPVENLHAALQKGFKIKPIEPTASLPKNYGFTPGNMAGQAYQGAKEIVGGLYDMGKDILFPPGASEAEKLKYLAHKYVIDPAKSEDERAESAATPWESLGHSAAAALPLVGPWAASLGEQAGKGDIGGALARGGTQVVASELGGKALKATKEVIGKGATQVARKAGMGGFTPAEALEKAGRPAVTERNFKGNVQRALPRLLDENKQSPIKTPEHMADAAHSAAEKLWNDEAQPQVDRHAAELMSGKNVADAIRNGVDEGTRDLFPDEAKQADMLADKLDGLMSLRKASAYLRTLNAQLKSFYRMDPQARYAKGMTDARLDAMENAADALRDGIYSRLEQLGEKDPTGLRKQYGALKQIERVFEKRAIVHGRQAPMNLPQAIGAIAGVMGHPIAAGVPLLTKYLNSPETLIKGALKDATPPSTKPSAALLPKSFRGSRAATVLGASGSQQNTDDEE